jgi:hypothetical protein
MDAPRGPELQGLVSLCGAGRSPAPLLLITDAADRCPRLGLRSFADPIFDVAGRSLGIVTRRVRRSRQDFLDAMNACKSIIEPSDPASSLRDVQMFIFLSARIYLNSILHRNCFTLN